MCTSGPWRRPLWQQGAGWQQQGVQPGGERAGCRTLFSSTAIAAGSPGAHLHHHHHHSLGAGSLAAPGVQLVTCSHPPPPSLPPPPLPWLQAAHIFRKMVDVVHHCHELGVMHRDLKPENFLLTSKGADAELKLTDFGLGELREGGAGERAAAVCVFGVGRAWRQRPRVQGNLV